MKQFFVLLLFVVALLSTLDTPASAEHRQVFLLGGQSNMVGFGAALPLPGLGAALPEVRFYFGFPTASPLPENTWVDLQPGGGAGFGPELSFGHALNNSDPHAGYALIKHARGGSDVYDDWHPEVSDNVYAAFRSTVDSALQALTDDGDAYEIVGMLWTQGIRDGKEGRSATEYQEDLEDLIADVRLNYGADIPFFISRLSINMTSASIAADGFSVPTCRIGRDTPVCPEDPALAGYGLNGIRTGQEAVAANDPLAFLIDTDEFGSDAVHFNSQGLIDLGDAFAESYLRNVVVPEPSSLTVVLALLTLGAVWRPDCIPRPSARLRQFRIESGGTSTADRLCPPVVVGRSHVDLL